MSNEKRSNGLVHDQSLIVTKSAQSMKIEKSVSKPLVKYPELRMRVDTNVQVISLNLYSRKI